MWAYVASPLAPQHECTGIECACGDVCLYNMCTQGLSAGGGAHLDVLNQHAGHLVAEVVIPTQPDTKERHDLQTNKEIRAAQCGAIGKG